MTTEHVAARINAWEVAQRQFDLAAERLDLDPGMRLVAATDLLSHHGDALLDLAPFRNADALLHVVRMFRDPAVPHRRCASMTKRG